MSGFSRKILKGTRVLSVGVGSYNERKNFSIQIFFYWATPPYREDVNINSTTY